MSSRTVSRSVVVVLITLIVIAMLPNAVAGRSTFCSPSGDVCYGAFGKGANVKLRISLFAHYFTTYRLCVTAPDRKIDCRHFRVLPAGHGTYASTVSWANHFPFRGAGLYHARWGWGSGLGRRIDFREGPSINVRPARVHAGARIRVFGLAGGCPAGDSVTLLSEGFPHTHEFAGVPALYAEVDRQDSYSTLVRIPSSRSAGIYHISARCGGGNFGVYASFTVLRP